MIEELSILDLEQTLQREKLLVVLFYTPFCGTCKVAETMLGVTLAALPKLSACKCNINFMPNRVKAWKIRSVPCLGVFVNGRMVEQIYAVRSVDYLYERLKPFAHDSA